MTRLSRRALGGVATAAILMGSARAQDNWPNRPIRWIVPYAAGGGSDFLARLLGQALTDVLGQPIVVENRGGGATIPASLALTQSAPDGYTMLSADLTSLVITPAAAAATSLPYDPIRDFKPAGTTAQFPYVLIVHPSIPAANAAELIALAKSRPNTLNFAHAGARTPNHLGTERLVRATQIQITQVAYRGGAPALMDLVAGIVQASVSDLASASSQIEAGRVRVLGVHAPQRLDVLPNVPTLTEQGITGADVYSWQGIVFPAQTPDAIIERLQNAVQRVLANPEIIRRLRAAGLAPFPGSAASMRDLIRSETAVWAPLVKELGLTLDN